MAVSRRGFLSTGATLLAGFGAGTVLPDERADAGIGAGTDISAAIGGSPLVGGLAPGRVADLALYRPVRVSSALYAPTAVRFAADRPRPSAARPTRAGPLATAGEPQWIAVDLQAPCTVEAVTLVFDAPSDHRAAALSGIGGTVVDFELAVSPDGDRWTSVYRATAETGGRVDVEFPAAVSAQWVRMTSRAGSDANPVSLNGLQVYGTRRRDGRADADARLQLADYENTRAVFEAWNAKLWNASRQPLSLLRSSSHPVLHSTVWQNPDDDPDVSGAYYGSRKGSEPLHVQANPDTWQVLAANHTARALHGASIVARVYDMAGRQLSGIEQQGVNIPPSSSAPGFVIGWPSSVPVLHLLRLELLDSDGAVLSQNTYWRHGATQDVRALDSLGRTRLSVSVSNRHSGEDDGDGDGDGDGDERSGRDRLTATVTNRGAIVAAMVRLALQDRSDASVLPAQYDDNYFWLLPGESREIVITWPTSPTPTGASGDAGDAAPATEATAASAAMQRRPAPQVSVRAYNAAPQLGR